MSDDPYTGTVMPVTDATYNARVINSQKPVLLAFLKNPDSSSQAMRPVLADVAREKEADLRVAVVEVNSNPVTAGRWGVTKIPTMVLLHKGVVERVLLGVRPTARLLNEIDNALNR